MSEQQHWRELAPHERLRAGDEFLFAGEWTASASASLTSHIEHLPCRRRVRWEGAPAGYRLADGGEKTEWACAPLGPVLKGPPVFILEDATIDAVGGGELPALMPWSEDPRLITGKTETKSAEDCAELSPLPQSREELIAQGWRALKMAERVVLGDVSFVDHNGNTGKVYEIEPCVIACSASASEFVQPVWRKMRTREELRANGWRPMREGEAPGDGDMFFCVGGNQEVIRAKDGWGDKVTRAEAKKPETFWTRRPEPLKEGDEEGAFERKDTRTELRVCTWCGLEDSVGRTICACCGTYTAAECSFTRENDTRTRLERMVDGDLPDVYAKNHSYLCSVDGPVLEKRGSGIRRHKGIGISAPKPQVFIAEQYGEEFELTPEELRKWRAKCSD